MNVAALQDKLRGFGYEPGPSDGALGPLTYAALLDYTACRKIGERGAAIATAMAHEFPNAGIDSRLRIIHAIAQACHESGAFRYMQELGGADYFKRYDPGTTIGKSLGNTEPGDGARFHGRGIIQCTGRSNYSAYGKKLGLDLIDNPDLAAQPDNAVRIFCAYWTDHGLNALADADDLYSITKAINGGVNGLADRSENVRRLKAVWPA